MPSGYGITVCKLRRMNGLVSLMVINDLTRAGYFLTGDMHQNFHVEKFGPAEKWEGASEMIQNVKVAADLHLLLWRLSYAEINLEDIPTGKVFCWEGKSPCLTFSELLGKQFAWFYPEPSKKMTPDKEHWQTANS